MKYIRFITVLIFSLMIIIPLVTFNFQSNQVSEIDNRLLAENPFTEEGSFAENAERYISDRTGFRDEMILVHAVFNDLFFHKMTHPSYAYGKDGYVFGAGVTVEDIYSPYHDDFADMVLEIQLYCEERGVPFLFVFQPAKPAVMDEYLPNGVNYDRVWVDKFFVALDERGVRYLDNTNVLSCKFEEGVDVFNKLYDANHWNDLGAYYGVNAILSEIGQDFSTVKPIPENEISIGKELMTTLPVSEFPIDEYVPVITVNSEYHEELTETYGEELYRDPSFQVFGYCVNDEKKFQGTPRVLCFQGSYMNHFGVKYMASALGEYIYIHDYQNILNFEYYYNIFNPEYVIFEVAEYSISDDYFNAESLIDFRLAPTLGKVVTDGTGEKLKYLDRSDLVIDRCEVLTTVLWKGGNSPTYAWISLDHVYNMQKKDDGFEITIPTNIWDAYSDAYCIYATEGGTMARYDDSVTVLEDSFSGEIR